MPAANEVLIDKGLELVVRGHFVALAAFLVQADPPRLALGVVILDPHRDDGADPGKGRGHDRNQRPVA
jgi:hypothetical protein